MTTTETPETAEELIERALTLTPEARERIALALLRSIDPPPGRPDSDWEYWKAEIARRIEAVENRSVKAYPLEEAMAMIRKAREERAS